MISQLVLITLLLALVVHEIIAKPFNIELLRSSSLLSPVSIKNNFNYSTRLLFDERYRNVTTWNQVFDEDNSDNDYDKGKPRRKWLKKPIAIPTRNRSEQRQFLPHIAEEEKDNDYLSSQQLRSHKISSRSRLNNPTLSNQLQSSRSAATFNDDDNDYDEYNNQLQVTPDKIRQSISAHMTAPKPIFNASPPINSTKPPQKRVFDEENSFDDIITNMNELQVSASKIHETVQWLPKPIGIHYASKFDEDEDEYYHKNNNNINNRNNNNKISLPLLRLFDDDELKPNQYYHKPQQPHHPKQIGKSSGLKNPIPVHNMGITFEEDNNEEQNFDKMIKPFPKERTLQTLQNPKPIMHGKYLQHPY